MRRYTSPAGCGNPEASGSGGRAPRVPTSRPTTCHTSARISTKKRRGPLNPRPPTNKNSGWEKAMRNPYAHSGSGEGARDPGLTAADPVTADYDATIGPSTDY